MSEALFRSAHQALLFAYTYAATQHGTAGAAERQIALSAKDRYGRVPGSGRGLRGLDGAAQAGMIRSLVERNTPPAFRLAVRARFSVLDVKARRDAVIPLALRARHSLPPHVPAWAVVELVAGSLGMKVNLAHIADRCEVDVRTVRNWRLASRKFVASIEAPGMAQVEVLLEDAGIVHAANSPADSPASTPW
jgi:hypothetical protein